MYPRLEGLQIEKCNLLLQPIVCFSIVYQQNTGLIESYIRYASDIDVMSITDFLQANLVSHLILHK